MELNQILDNIDGLTPELKKVLSSFVNHYIDISSVDEKQNVENNIKNLIQKNLKQLSFKDLGEISGRVSGIGTEIELNSTLDEQYINNTFMHELIHLLGKNEKLINDEDSYVIRQFNLGFKLDRDSAMDSIFGDNKDWTVNGNCYGKGNILAILDEWFTEWAANNASGYNITELRENANGYFKTKFSHGYDGSNIMNLLQAVYGEKILLNTLIGANLNDNERDSIIPLKGIAQMDDMIDSKNVISQEDFENIQTKTRGTLSNPTIFAKLYYLTRMYQKSEKEDLFSIQSEMQGLLTAAYQEKLTNITTSEQLLNCSDEIALIYKSLIFNKNSEVNEQLPAIQNFGNIVAEYNQKAKDLDLQPLSFEMDPKNIYQTMAEQCTIKPKPKETDLTM